MNRNIRRRPMDTTRMVFRAPELRSMVSRADKTSPPVPADMSEDDVDEERAGGILTSGFKQVDPFSGSVISGGFSQSGMDYGGIGATPPDEDKN